MRIWTRAIFFAVGVLVNPAGAAGGPSGEKIVISRATFVSQNAGRDWSFNTSGSPPCIYRFEVHSGDVWPHDVDTGQPTVERSEVTGPIDATNVGGYGVEVWTAYQFKIEIGESSSSPWVVMGDWHMQMDPGDIGVSSPWQLELLAGDLLGFDTRTSTEKPIRTNPHMHYIWKSSAPVVRGAWHSLVSRTVFDWHTAGKGAIDMWLDGEQVVSYRGPVGFNTARPPYFKFGIYRSAAPEPLSVDYTNVDVSLSSLMSRVSQPPAICGEKKPWHSRRRFR
jgi:hypothetical protein